MDMETPEQEGTGANRELQRRSVAFANHRSGGRRCARIAAAAAPVAAGLD
jgi:hypothetical protein